MIIFPVKVFIYRYYAMMDNTLAKKCRKPPKNHPFFCRNSIINFVFLYQYLKNDGMGTNLHPYISFSTKVCSAAVNR